MKKIQTTISFVDIAGLVEGASKGEGLGNKFLSHIREVDAIIHMLRCFDSVDIQNVNPDVNPIRDLEIIETEMKLADIESIQKRIDKKNRKNIEAKEINVSKSIDINNEKNSKIGELRSGVYSPHFKKVIGIAMLNKPYYEVSQTIKISINGDVFEGKVCDLPFI